MTVIVGIATGATIHLAADRQVQYGNQAVHGARKLRRIALDGGDVVIGVAGSGALMTTTARMLAQTGLPNVPPNAAADDAVDDWANMVAEAITALAAATNPPVTITREGQSGDIDGAVLLGVAGRLYYLFGNQSARAVDGIATLGIGSELALGAVLVGLRHGLTPDEVAAHAVELACRYIPGCGLGGQPPLMMTLP